MAITSSGVICDVCGQYILLEPYSGFTLKSYGNKQFHCHSTGMCEDILFRANSWKDLLPESPIRKAMEIVDAKVKELVND